MKKILLSLSFLVAVCCYTFAQTVTISGTIADPNGGTFSNYPVWVASDSTSGINFFQTALTNNNGLYSVSANVGSVTQGNFYVSIQDTCTGAFSVQTVSFSPNNMTINNVDFTVCTTINPPTSCQAGLYYQSSAMGYAFTGLASGGTAPYTYFWDFGNGATSTTQNPVYNYNIPGTYYPCLTIADAAGCTAVYCDSLGIIVSGGGGGMNCDVSFTYQTLPSGTVNFTSSTSNTTGTVYYYWDFGNGDTSSMAFPSYTYNSPGVYFPCVSIVDASGCLSTYCDSLLIGGGSSCSATINYSMSATGVSASVSSTGTGPYTYSWTFGNGTSSTSANPNIVYTTLGTYVICVTVTDATGCVATDCVTVTITSQTSGDLNVLVVSDSLTIAQSVVYLIEHDTANGTLTAIQTDTAIQGYATFTNVPFGDYLVKAALLPSDPNFANYLPTYFQQSLTWSGATSVDVSPNVLGFALIELIQGNNVGGGPGFIGGLISQGANRGPGDPLVNALVILYDENMNPIAYTYTDINGEYSFDNLPYGVYYIYVEELGVQAEPIEVTLSVTTPSMDQVNFDVNATRATFTSTHTLQSVASMKVFPNPVTDQLYMQIDLDQMIDADITINSMTGQVLQQRKTTLTSGNHVINFETQELPVGVYTLQLRSNLGVVTHKFVKQ